jgi:signal transduction histidine kinase
MNSLLKRQIRKFLNEELKSNNDLTDFIEAVNLSYNNFDDQSTMIQRAMTISSEELYAANRKLQKEADEQQEVINKLRNVINTLKFYNLDDNEAQKENDNGEEFELTGSNLVDFIDDQTKEIVEMNKQKQSLLNELAYQNQELSDYAHMVSHDLKSPLRSIDALTMWLKQDYSSKLDNDGKKTLDLIRTNVNKMDALISGILEYSTIGKGEIEFYDIDLNKLIDEILKSTQVPEHINITIFELPTIKGDKYRLKQLFQNLIGNAIKYNNKEKGTIQIGVKDQDQYWLFYVRDNGKGIDKAYFSKIFKTFIKLENNPDSSGIGLSIVKKIVELYAGKIWLESEINIGTTFYFTLKKSLNGAAQPILH